MRSTSDEPAGQLKRKTTSNGTSRGAGDVRVAIGRELGSPAMQACALISAPYRVGAGDVAGTISVIGPMRLEYARLMAVVGYVAHEVERMLHEEGAAA